MYRRIISGLLAAMFVLAGCAQSGTGEETSTTASETTAAPVETTADPNDRSQVKDSVPDGLMFEGETIRVLYRGDGDGKESIEAYEVVGTDNSGDMITDVVWNRNRSVEERLGITLKLVPGASARGTIVANIRQSVMAASDDYDYIQSSGNTSITEGLSPYMQDLAHLPYVDYEKEWWWQDAIHALSLDGKTYHYIFGDLNVQCYIQSGVFYYNKDLYEDLFGNPDEMYDYVTEGTWTLDLLREKTQAAYSDANGDGAVDAGDVHGLLLASNPSTQNSHFIEGFALELYHYDENDQLVIEFDQERTVQAIEKLSDLLYNTTGSFLTDRDIDNGDEYFAEGNYLFFPARFKRALGDSLRSMETPYGILPYPKLTEEQPEYTGLSATIPAPPSAYPRRFPRRNWKWWVLHWKHSVLNPGGV